MAKLVSLALCSLMLGLVGCGISGTWVRQSVFPPAARNVFKPTKLTLFDSGAVEATYADENGTYTTRGTYHYDNGQLRISLPEIECDRNFGVILSDLDLYMTLSFETFDGPVIVEFLRIK